MHRPHYEEFKKNQQLVNEEDVQFLIMEDTEFSVDRIDDINWKSITPPGSPSATEINEMNLEEDSNFDDPELVDADGEFAADQPDPTDARHTVDQVDPIMESTEYGEDPNFQEEAEETEDVELGVEESKDPSFEELPEDNEAVHTDSRDDPMDTKKTKESQADFDEEEVTANSSTIATRSKGPIENPQDEPNSSETKPPKESKKKKLVVDATSNMTHQITRLEATGEVIEEEGTINIAPLAVTTAKCAICNREVTLATHTCCSAVLIDPFSSPTQMNCHRIFPQLIRMIIYLKHNPKCVCS